MLGRVALLVLSVPLLVQEPLPRFRAGIDLLTVEASVLDKQGRPVADLQPGDFSVTVAGRPRKVLFARFTGAQPSTVKDTGVGAASNGAGLGPAPASMSAAPGRIVLFVVDRDSIRSGNELTMLETASRLIEGLSPNDAVGLSGIPGPAIELTRDHARVRAALQGMSGMHPRQVVMRDRTLSWDEALAYENNDLRVIKEVVERECHINEPQCPIQMHDQARELLATGRAQIQTVMHTLTRLADNLAVLHGPKQIILMSGGLGFGQDMLPYFEAFAKKAAVAQVVCSAIHLDQPDSDTTDRKTVTSAFGGRHMAQGLSTIAGMTGGGFYNGIGRATGVFERIKIDLENFYELAIETLPEDLTGTPRDLRVKVNRPGAAVRSRRQVTLPDRATAAAWLSDPVGSLLAQPTDITELSLGISASTTGGDSGAGVRVALSGQIGGGAAKAPVDWGFAVLQEANVVATGRGRIAADAAAPWTVTTSANISPGSYRLRFAAADAGGRAGVVDVPLIVESK